MTFSTNAFGNIEFYGQLSLAAVSTSGVRISDDADIKRVREFIVNQ